MIDIHTHCMTAEHWGEEFSRNWAHADHYGAVWPTVSPADFDAAMAEAGVETAIVFGITARRVGVVTPFEHVLEFCGQASTATVPFAALDLADEDLEEQLEQVVRDGARGIKLYPVLSGHDPLDTGLKKFYERVGRLNLPIIWHMGTSPSAAADLRLGQPMIIDAVAQRYPHLVHVIAHMAHPWQREAIMVARKQPNVFLDVSAQWQRPLEGSLALIRAQEWGVVEKLLFGSDFPLWTPLHAEEALRCLAGTSVGGAAVEQSTIERVLTVDGLERLGIPR